MNANKERFMKEVVSEWDAKAAEREADYETSNI
jgi:hypothetical protein